jgi:hypothetical protein
MSERQYHRGGVVSSLNPPFRVGESAPLISMSAARQCATSAYAEHDNTVMSGRPVCGFPAPSGSGANSIESESRRG